MSNLSLSCEICIPPDRLFTHLAAEFEGGTGLGGQEAGTRCDGQLRMGLGLCIQCPGEGWALPEDMEVEVVEFQAPKGWRAVSRSGGDLSFEVRIRPSPGGSLLTCFLKHRPEGLWAGIREVIRLRRRRAAIQELLEEWKKNAERQEALRRLRAASRNHCSGSSEERAS
jgi:hypothetical protein